MLLEGPATSEFEEDGVWDGIFASGDIDAEVFYEVGTVILVTYDAKVAVFVSARKSSYDSRSC